jgi:small conductance mechanosensitive channel
VIVPPKLLSTTQPHLVATHGLTMWDWVHAAVIVAVTVALSQMVRRITLKAFGTHSNRPAARISARFAAYLIAAGGLLYSLNALHVKIGPLVGALGIGGIALAFALQDILQNLVAGVILQARRPIRHGDQVEVGHYQGTVLDIDLRNVQLRTFDGLDVYLPNRLVLDGAIVNYTMSPLRRLTLEIGIGYRTDLSDAQRCLLHAVSSVDAVLPEPAPAAWVTEFGDSSVKFSVLFWYSVADYTFWEVRSAVAISIQQTLRDAGIRIPYPIRTLEVDESTFDEIDLRQRADR